jgi:hypothetical protein
MKTVIKSFLLGLSMFATFVALLIASASAVNARPMANDNKAITTVRHTAFVASAGNVVNVNVEKPAGQVLRVAFVNKSGKVLAEQFVSKQAGSFGMKFNVAQLPDGDYKVRIMGKEVVGEYSFTLKTGETPARTLTVE